MDHLQYRRLKLKRKRRRTGFTAAEQSFFATGDHLADKQRVRAESFEDLDQGRGPDSFWARLARQPELG